MFLILFYLPIFIISFIFVWYLYYSYGFTYWKRKGLPYIKPSFPAGNILPAVLGKKSIFNVLQDLYNEIKGRGLKGAGIYFFNGPIYVPTDPQIVKKILVTDFDHFLNRGFFVDKVKYPLTSHLLSVYGEEWKKSRVKFSPTFTSGKMKMMFNILKENCQNLVKILDKNAENEEIVDIQLYMTKMTIDIISSCVLGINSNCVNDPNSEYFRVINRIFNQPKWRYFALFFTDGFQNPGNIMKIPQSDRIVEDFFNNLLRENIDYRKKNNIRRDDFLDILIDMMDSKEINFEELVSQAHLFFTGGYETSATTMSFCIHELSINQTIQDELRREIHENLGTDCSEFIYEEILELPLLDRVIKETLRKYPVLAMLNRVCTKKWTVPDTNVTLDEGNLVLISVLGLHRDPEYHPNPLKFDPSRFEREMVPYTYLPFGTGPRNCIGTRFGLLQTKLGISSLLCHYKFLPTPDSPDEIQIDPKPTAIVVSPLKHIETIIIKV